MSIHSERLDSLREAMIAGAIDYYFLPAGDPHLGEYIPDYWRQISWLTGFSGSSSTVVITSEFAGLWTDSRYFIQAQKELEDSGFIFMKPDPYSNNDSISWLINNCKPGCTIGVDGSIISEKRMCRLENALASLKVHLITTFDPFRELWIERPKLPDTPATDFPVTYAGIDRGSKINAVRKELSDVKADFQLLTSPDDIMWLLNIRGSDSRFAPVLSCFAIVGMDQLLLFADENRFPFRLAMTFDKEGIVLLPYEETESILATLPWRTTIIASRTTTSSGLYRSIRKQVKIKDVPSIPSRLKAIKNKTEIGNISKAMIYDGVALTRFFFWLYQNHGSADMSEYSLGEKLEGFRASQEGYLGPSFSPIVAFNKHSALPHYTATHSSDSLFDGNGILLVDSGGQYFYGTTDITRTIILGNPSSKQIKDFTLVLKGNIALARAKIPAGTKGIQIDILARQALWEHGLNYGHGTGHGVGYCLNVHEAPPSVSPADTPETRSAIAAGMLFSNEPALYREGEYGIRTENLLLCYEDKETEFGTFLRFETVSLCYIDRKLIDVSLLSHDEIAWLNRYHQTVREKLTPYLSEEEGEWLSDMTRSI
jgi:Xaa-Pro aminopeptidase